MNYEAIIKSLRELARDSLRLSAMSGLWAERYDIELDSKEAGRHLAVIKYELDKLDNEHPNYADKYKELNKQIESQEQYFENIGKCLDKTDKRIKDTISGETKVNKEMLSAETDKLITAYIKERVSELE